VSCSGFDADFLSLKERLGGPGRAASLARALRQGRPAAASGVRAEALEGLSFHTPTLDQEVTAGDGTRKFRFSGVGGAWETVLIPSPSRSTVCVSTQVGCRRGCAFCATGTLDRPNNLSLSAIIHQVWYALGRAGAVGAPPVRNVVFMGMGEPLDNLLRVEAALERLTDGRLWGFGPRHITVSTVAPSPAAVARMRHWSARLAWSLHAADEAKRRRLVASQRYSVQELAAAFRALSRPLFVEMTLIDGLNDGDEDAEAVLRLFEDFEAELRFNLLPVNPSEVRPGFLRPSPQRVEAFAVVLRSAGHRVMIRRPRGDDEAAACGQLVTIPRRGADDDSATRSAPPETGP